MKKLYVYSEYTETIREMPANYWIATVKGRKLIFDSWDKAPKYNKLWIWILWILRLIKPDKHSLYYKENLPVWNKYFKPINKTNKMTHKIILLWGIAILFIMIVLSYSL